MKHLTRTTLLTVLTAGVLAGEVLSQAQTNPLTRSQPTQSPTDAPTDPFARTFRGEGIRLVLKRSASGYSGTLRFGDQDYPVTARVLGPSLRGSFRANGEDWPFTAKLTADRMTLSSDGSEFQLTGDPLPKATLRTTASKAGLSFVQPSGWSIADEDRGIAYIAPEAGHAMEGSAVQSIHALSLTAEERAMTLEDLTIAMMDRVFPTMTLGKGLKISVDLPQGGERRQGGTTWYEVPMNIRSGEREGRGWLGVKPDGDRALVCWVVGLAPHTDKALDAGKSVFASLRRVGATNENPLKKRGTQRAGRADRASAKGHVVLQRRTVTDPGFGGIESHRFLAPKGWRTEAEVLWTQHPNQYLHFVARIEDRDGAAVTFGRNTAFAYGDPTTLQMHGASDGRSFADGTIHAEPPQSAGEAAIRLLLPQLRPEATNATLVHAAIDEEAQRQLMELFKPIFETLQQNGNQLKGWMHCESALVEYEENGQRFEEELRYVVNGAHCFGVELVSGPWGKWTASHVRSIRAPKGQLDDRRALLETILASVRETPRWAISKHELKMQDIRRDAAIGRAALAGMQERGRIIARNNAEISEMQMAGYRDRARAQDRMRVQTIRGIQEVQPFRSRSGETLEIDQRFDHVFENRQGELLLTTDPTFDPAADPGFSSGDWSRLAQSR